MKITNEIIFDVKDLKIKYGVIEAVKNISFSIQRGEFISLVGSNGAGKTSILKACAGLIPCQGLIHFKNQPIHFCEPHNRVKLKMSLVPEGRGIFSSLSVNENIDLGAYSRVDEVEIKKDKEKIFDLFPRLAERQNQIAGTLSGGEQQMLSLGRALMSRPEFLMLDEPSMGLAPLIVEEIFQLLKKLNSEGLTILLVEQNAKMALAQSHRAYVLETGKIVLEGQGRELLKDIRVQQSYLGIE